MEEINEQINLVKNMEGENELILDDITFNKFTPEIKEKIEKLT